LHIRAEFLRGLNVNPRKITGGERDVRRKKAGAVRLSDHAYERWKLRVGPASKNSVANRIRRRIASELKLGAEVNRNGALEIKVRPGVWAICYPSLMGGWEVATIIREGWEEDMEEKAIYGGGNEDRLGKEQYEATQNLLLSQAALIAMLPLEKFIRSINCADSIGSILDPTLYQKVLYGQGADNWQTIKDIAAAALQLKKAVKKAEERYIARIEKERESP